MYKTDHLRIDLGTDGQLELEFLKVELMVVPDNLPGQLQLSRCNNILCT